MHPEVEALAAAHHLPPSTARAVAELVARLAGPAPTLVPDDPHEPAGPVAERSSGQVPDRYEDLGRIGVGGMGEVRRVRDRELGRLCALKVVRADLADRERILARFVEEAQVGAQLQHPNIPPVYDAGRLPDGRAWFTMKEVRGRTLTEHLREVHAGEPTDAALRRLVDAFAKVCDAVGYAHERGVVHRDLKPDNVVVGGHGEVLVLDWGLAKVLGRPDRALESGELEPEVASSRSTDASQRTTVGGVLGTAAYMPPEQAAGRVDLLDARSDVYALGALLYELLSGRAPYEGPDARAVLQRVLAGPPPSLRFGPLLEDDTLSPDLDLSDREPARTTSLPEELVALCEVCMAREPAARPADGRAVAAEARAWLDGVRKREQAREVVAEADQTLAEAAALRDRARSLRAEGDARLAGVPTWAPEEQKALAWATLDEAERAERRAALLATKHEGLLRGALTHAPDLEEAHVALVALELGRHREAEAVRDPAGTERAERRLREVAEALPEGHPSRQGVAAYLRGTGALTLRTDPEGAEVDLYRYELRNRRLVPVLVRGLGRAPLAGVPLPMGSYLCVLRHPEREEVRYPVSIARGEHWEGVPPGAREPEPVRLPRRGELGPDDRLMPAGFAWTGGDPTVLESLPRRRLWCDDLVVRRFPVTNREYLLFLQDLVASGREEEALRHQPRERSNGEGTAVYGRDAEGHFFLKPDADGDVWSPDFPVVLVTWYAARAYAAWLSARTGRAWRLPGELEWEKAARGVDGRFCPWGDFADASWACLRTSHRSRPLLHEVDTFPVDESVYGVRGLAGNSEDWCLDDYAAGGPLVEGERVVAPTPPEDAASARSVRGGAWYGTLRFARCANRARSEPGSRIISLGFRLVHRPVWGP